MDADLLLRQLAAIQHGLVTRAQASCSGVDSDAVDHRCNRGEWIPLGHRVLRAVSSADSVEQRALAAVLDAGEGAALSHHSAASWWGLPGFELTPTEVTVARCADERRGRLLSGPSVRRVLDEVAASGVRGVRLLRALLDDRGPGYVPPASGLEA